MDELVEFLRARLAEDKQRVEAAGEGRIAWLTYLDDQGQMHYTTVASGSDMAVGPDNVWVANGKELPAPARVLVVYDSARALAEVEAKRRMLDDLYPEVKGMDEAIEGEWPGESDAADMLLRLLAAPYADHPDYREEWRP